MTTKTITNEFSEDEEIEIPSWQAYWLEYAPYFALIVSLVATTGSLYFSEIRYFEPCRLCWFQRIFMYPLAIMMLVGVVKQDEGISDYVLPIATIGWFIAIYHIGMQFGFIALSTACTGVSCGVTYINWLGFITIPVLSFTAFTLILISLGTYRYILSTIED
ncbi:MAG: disulfide oxidoreductase [Chloroflexota bacterium]